MKLTSNYNLKKPDESDVVNIQDINNNTDKIDDELKKVSVKMDDMSFTTASNRVNIESGDTRKVVLGKIAKWFGDLKGLAFKDKVAVDDLDSSVIAHNLTTVDVGKVLGADQGGVLHGKIMELNDNLEEFNCNAYYGDLNELDKPGIYNFNAGSLNSPTSITQWGFLLNLVPEGNASYQTQVVFDMTSGNAPISIRMKHNNLWREWRDINNDLDYEFFTNTSIFLVADSTAPGSERRVRIIENLDYPIGYSTSSDFFYNIMRLHDESVMYWRIMAYDVRSNRTFSIAKINGELSGWREIMHEDNTPKLFTTTVDPKGNNYVDINIADNDKSSLSNRIIAANGDYNVWGGYVLGVGQVGEKIRIGLSERKSGMIRLNIFYSPLYNPITAS